ncbi:MAG: hypothetical protein ACHQPI_01680 [Thermoanaerobaculia bacterium]
MTLENCYEDAIRAAAYARLEFPGTYYLAYRDLPALIGQHVQGARALDFGCGSGRSTRDIAALLAPTGTFINLVSAPEIYLHEWASFSTRSFPENAQAKSGDRVRIVITDIADGRPVEDVVCSDADYRRLYAEAGLNPVRAERPLGKPEEPYRWINETRIAPWVIYVLKRL